MHDEAHDPLVDVKVRPLSWLARRLSGEDPVSLWVYQRAAVLQDPDQHIPALLAQAEDAFRLRLPELVRERCRDLRSAVTIEHGREPLARQIMLGKAVEAALTLPLLARREPYPYPKWQAWHLTQRHPQGGEIVRLCHALLSGDGEGPDCSPREIPLEISISPPVVWGKSSGIVENRWESGQ